MTAPVICVACLLSPADPDNRFGLCEGDHADLQASPQWLEAYDADGSAEAHQRAFVTWLAPRQRVALEAQGAAR